MKVPKDALLAIGIGFGALCFFVGGTIYGLYYFFTGGCDENSEPYTAYEVRQMMEEEYALPMDLEYLGETVVKDKPWKRVDYSFRDKGRDFIFTVHANVRHIQDPFDVRGGRFWYSDYPSRCLDSLNGEVQRLAQKHGVRFMTPEEKAARPGYDSSEDTIFVSNESQLPGAAELFLEIADLYDVGRFGEDGAWRDVAVCYLPPGEDDLDKAQLLEVLLLRGKTDVYEANDISERTLTHSQNPAEPFLHILINGWEDKDWSDGAGSGSLDGAAPAPLQPAPGGSDARRKPSRV